MTARKDERPRDTLAGLFSRIFPLCTPHEAGEGSSPSVPINSTPLARLQANNRQRQERSFAAAGAPKMNCSSGPGAASGAHSRNVAQWQSREHGGRGRPDTGSSPVVPIWSMCVIKRTGGMRHTAKLTPSRYGANCDDGDYKKPVRNPRQPGETGTLWSTYGRSAEGKTQKPILPPDADEGSIPSAPLLWIISTKQTF